MCNLQSPFALLKEKHQGHAFGFTLRAGDAKRPMAHGGSEAVPPLPRIQSSLFLPLEPFTPRGGLDVIRKEAWSFYRTISGVRLCWELEEPKGPKGPVQDSVLTGSMCSQVPGSCFLAD